MPEEVIRTQECPDCGKTLEGEDLKFCPYCGTVLKEEPNTEDHVSLKNAIKDIIKSEGREIIKNDKRKFIALLKDKTSGFLKQIRHIEKVLSDDIIVQILLKADDGSDEEKLEAISRIINRLIREFDIRRLSAIAITSYLTSGLGWEMQIVAPEKIETLPITDDASDIPDGKNETNNRPGSVHNTSSVAVGENHTEKERPSFGREPYKNSKLNALFWMYCVCVVVAVAFAISAIVLAVRGELPAGVVALLAAILPSVLDTSLKRSFEKIVDGEIERDAKASSVQDTMVAADYYFG